jgi:AmpD protein
VQKTEYKIKGGRLCGAKWCPSPNYNERGIDVHVDLLVIHNISLPPAQFANGYIEAFFQNRLPAGDHPYFSDIAGLKVSAHLLIARNGDTTQFVNLNDRAWHAGESCFEGRVNCNDFSIGIEMEGTDDIPYTYKQYETLAEITHTLFGAYPKLFKSAITGHSDIAPGRKTDPGESFNWSFFRQLLDS